MLLYNLKLVFRNIRNNKFYSILSITGFAIGFAVCVIIGLFAYNEYTVDNCYPNHSNIFRVVNEKKKTSNIDYNLGKLLADNNPEIQRTCPLDVMMDIKYAIKSDRQFIEGKSLGVTNNNFFKIFSVNVISGSKLEPFTGKKTVIITKSVANKLFKKGEDPIGRSINIYNYFNANISAVIEDFPANSSINAEVLLNFENEEFRFTTSCETNDKCINPVNHYLLLDSRVNQADFQKKLNKNIGIYSFAIDSIGLQPLQKIYLDKTIIDSKNQKGSLSTILIFVAIGILIMVLSSVNYLNFNISQQYSKLREIGIRRINGAEISHLIKYYLTEVTVGILISVDVALIIVALILPQLNILLGKQLALDSLLSPSIILISLGIIATIVIVNSIVPFYFLTRASANTFFSGKKLVKGKLRGRNFLTIFQFVATITLITCVILIQKQIGYIQKANLGFNKEHLLMVSIPFNFTKQESLKHEVNKLPFVVGSTLSHGIPSEINFWMGSGDSTKKGFSIACIMVDNDFMKVMGLELTEGRSFLTGDVGKSCIMNQEAVKRFEWQNIDNKRYNNGQKGGYEVVGVVKNFHFESHHRPILPACLLSYPYNRYSELYNYSIKITPGEIGNKIQQIEQIWKKLLPEDSMNFIFYDSIFEAMYRKEKLLAAIIMFFSIIAIVLSCMGILGQVFQTCINRTKEIGIRKVNGARTFTIIKMLNFDFVRLILVAFVIACPLSYFIMEKWFQNFAYKTDMSWWVFLLAGAVILTISFITVTWHSWLTVSKNPVEALRYE